MTFTDDDLKIFKGLVDKKVISFFGKTKKIRALLARLEAAERIVELCDAVNSGLNHSHEALIKWRKVAGK